MLSHLLLGVVALTTQGTWGNRTPAPAPGPATNAPPLITGSGQGQSSQLNSFCQPGIGGFIPCPCGNPPLLADRGCDNSSATGGASIYWGGNASLSADTLVFGVSDAKPNVLSILLQGTAQIPNGGVVYGQGIRCVGGHLKRLFREMADNTGHIEAPSPNDTATVSQRSAQLGDQLAPGIIRYYMAYYRDHIVLGGCPPSSTFNDTQAWQINWTQRPG